MHGVVFGIKLGINVNIKHGLSFVSLGSKIAYMKGMNFITLLYALLQLELLSYVNWRYRTGRGYWVILSKQLNQAYWRQGGLLRQLSSLFNLSYSF